MSQYIHFLPWLRDGLATEVQPSGLPDGTFPSTPTIDVTLTLQSTETATGDLQTDTSDPVRVRLRGPGDVVGVASSEVIRQFPPTDSVGVAPNLFAYVEFASADFPWRYSPDSTRDNRGMPWLTLIVVEHRSGVSLQSQPGLPDRLDISDAARELPNLQEAWAWAHVQAKLGETTEALDSDILTTAFGSTRDDFRARLLCPRRLDPHRKWIAALVPTFMIGRRVGLGESIAQGDLDAPTTLAWEPTEGEVSLPVYLSWTFETGERGDFELLARKLEPAILPPTVGVRDLDVAQPGGGLPEVPEALATYTGALTALTVNEREWDGFPAFATALRDKINDSYGDLPKKKPGYDPLQDDPVVAMPAYGDPQLGEQWANRDQRIPDDGNPPLWFGELNVDVRHRVVAGLGAEVVRANQEALMEVAWEAAAVIPQVNATLNHARLAAEVGAVAADRLQELPDEQVLMLEAPARRRATFTNDGMAGLSHLPGGMLQGAFRRLTRVNGSCHVRSTAPFTKVPASTKVAKAFFGATQQASVLKFRDRVRPTGAVTTDAVSHQLVMDVSAIEEGMPEAEYLAIHESNVEATDEALANDPAIFDVDLTSRFVEQAAVTQVDPVIATALELKSQATPMSAIDTRLKSLVQAPSELWGAGPMPVSKMWIEPEFTTAMSEKLIDLSLDYFMPGVKEVPRNSVSLVKMNQRFAEAFLVGLNHEMSREFLWREYPSRLNGTWFRKFWNHPGIERDIAPISEWADSGVLGEHVQLTHDPTTEPVTDPLILLVNSELIRRYPKVQIYAIPAVRDSDDHRRREPGADRIDPTFQCTLAPGLRVFAFMTLDRNLAGNDPGYFIVFEDRPSEPRFGLDSSDLPPSEWGQNGVADWSDLSWATVSTANAPEMARFVDIAGAWNGADLELPGNGPSDDLWGEDAAAMARITLQRPFRVHFHVSAMLPDEPSGA